MARAKTKEPEANEAVPSTRDEVLTSLKDIGMAVVRTELQSKGLNPVMLALGEFALDAALKAILEAMEPDKVKILMGADGKAVAKVVWE